MEINLALRWLILPTPCHSPSPAHLVIMDSFPLPGSSSTCCGHSRALWGHDEVLQWPLFLNDTGVRLRGCRSHGEADWGGVEASCRGEGMERADRTASWGPLRTAVQRDRHEFRVNSTAS